MQVARLLSGSLVEVVISSFRKTDDLTSGDRLFGHVVSKM